ncbi:MAG: FCD domain-containing protein, partial [Chloroflexi bacterium]
AAKRDQLYSLILRYLDLSKVYQRMALSMGRGAADPIIEHIGLLEILERRDAEGACKMVRRHLELTMAELLSLFNEHQKKEQS